MERKNIYITQQQVDALKKKTEETGLKFSDLVRRAIDEYLKKEGRTTK